MKKFRDLKIAKKLVISFSLILLFTTSIGLFSIWQLHRVNASANELATNWLPSIKTLGEIKLLLARLRSNEAQLIVYAGDHVQAKKLTGRTLDILNDLKTALNTYEGQISEPEEKDVYPEASLRIKRLLQHHAAFMAALADGRLDLASTIFAGESSDIYFSLLKDVDTLANVNRRGGDQSAADTNRIYGESQTLICFALLTVLLIGGGLAMIVARAISQPLILAARIANTVAAGDLCTEIALSGNDETGQVIAALRHMNEELRLILNGVKSGAENVATASRQIASGNIDLSSRTEEQASSLQQTAAAMEQITSSIVHASAHSRQADALAVNASTVAGEAGQVVTEVVTTMSAIKQASTRIVEIIAVIDGIAFQTNILALNAAVEAARAGDEGRGFAVVAAEVRNLAQRSATAAREIKGLIDDTVEQVGVGSLLVQQAGETMRSVVGSVEQVTAIVAEIARASDDQSKGITEINFAIGQMDGVTQQNAALVEQAAAASQGLQDQAGLLSTLVGRFRLPADPSVAVLAPEGQAQ
ncbi:methyl-accepting chemotaxis protein [Herbaspirillum huttiense F1]|uniref:methyl-accepting chemotaxis protein n=1 Tax=Herbaspirillum huttiense TaxID=863372 RepID=UPI002883E6AC|nr:methyl-accepting chemotaxis protein [Herbaspirillum huttiense]MDT0357856.1 methyl-accepting chemotaxis protein [Herbaspirillum huttiense F1]